MSSGVVWLYSGTLGVLWSSCGYTVEHLVSSGVAVAIQWNTWCPLEYLWLYSGTLGVLWSSCGYRVEHLVTSGVAVAIQWSTW